MKWKQVIKNRIGYFESKFHAHEAGRLTLALKSIEELIPPSEFESTPLSDQGDVWRDYTAWIRENWLLLEDGLWRRKSDTRDERTDDGLFKEYRGLTKFASYQSSPLKGTEDKEVK